MTAKENTAQEFLCVGLTNPCTFLNNQPALQSNFCAFADDQPTLQSNPSSFLDSQPQLKSDFESGFHDDHHEFSATPKSRVKSMLHHALPRQLQKEQPPTLQQPMQPLPHTPNMRSQLHQSWLPPKPLPGIGLHHPQQPQLPQQHMSAIGGGAHPHGGAAGLPLVPSAPYMGGRMGASSGSKLHGGLVGHSQAEGSMQAPPGPQQPISMSRRSASIGALRR